MTQTALLLFSFLLATPALALPSLTPRLREGEIRLGLSTNAYLTSSGSTLSDERTGNWALNLGTRATGAHKNFRFGLEADSLYGLRKSNYRYISIAEAYGGYDQKAFSAYLGRKRYQWSELDSYWGLGLYQPRFRWDYLNEREAGLLGLFLGHESELVQVTAFWSPVFVPEQGAPFDIAGGSCKTASPWFSCPSSTMQLFNQTTDIQFSLDIPPIRRLVQKPGGGATVRVGRSTGWFGRASFARKPINQLLLSYEGRLDLSTLQVPAVIRPRRLMHTLWSTDIGYNRERWSVVGSSVLELPERDVTPAAWNTQETTRALLVGATAKWMPFSGQFRRTRFELSYFRRDGGNTNDTGPFVRPGTNVFEPRYGFENAYSLAAFSPIFDAWARRFLLSTRFVLDTANQGNILQLDTYYSPFARTFFNLGLDMLGSESRSPVDFIARYQRNDRVRGGVSYAF